MASYPAPTANTGIFDSLDFTTSSGDYLTIETAKNYFLEYPSAQGTENLLTTVVNGDFTTNGGTNSLEGDTTITDGTFLITTSSSPTEFATMTQSSLVFSDDYPTGASGTYSRDLMTLKIDSDYEGKITYEGFGYKSLDGGFAVSISQGTVSYGGLTDQCATKWNGQVGSVVYDTVINRSNLTQTEGNGGTITTSKTATISNIIDAGNGSFSQQVAFSNYAPHCDTLATQYNDLTTKAYVDALVGSNSGTGILMYLNYGVSSGISTYKQLANTYSLLSTTNATTTSLGTNLVAGFITDSNIPFAYGSSISAGIFNLNLYAYVSVNTGTLNAYFTINKYDTLTSTTTLIATSGNSSDINGTNSSAPDLYHMSCSFPTTTFLSTDRILLLLYTVGTGMGSGATITTEYQGSYYSYLLTPISSGSGSSLTTSNNIWTGTNTFSNTVSLYQPTVSTGPLTMPASSSILYGNTGTLTIGSSTNNITQSTGIRLPRYIDTVDLTEGIYLGYNHSGPQAYLRSYLPILSDGTGTDNAIYCNYYDTRASNVAINIGRNLVLGGINIGTSGTLTGAVSIGSTTSSSQTLYGSWTVGGTLTTNSIINTPLTNAVSLYGTATGTITIGGSGSTQTLSGTWSVGTLQTATISYPTAGTAISLFSTTTGGITIGGSGSNALNLNNLGNGLTKIGGTGTLQLGTAVCAITTSNSIQQISATNNLSLYTSTTGTITIGNASAGTQTLNGTWTLGVGLKVNTITNTAVGSAVSLYATSTGTISIGNTAAGTQTLTGTWTVGNSLIATTINSSATTVNLYASPTGTITFGDNASSLQLGCGTSIAAIQIGSATQTGTTTVYSGSTGIQLLAPLYANYGTSLTVPNQIGWTDSGNTTQTTGLQTAIGTYTVYANGSGATLSQLTQGIYLFCCNGELVINNGTGTCGSITLSVITNTGNTTVGATTFKALLAPPTSLFGMNMYSISPFTASQVLTISALNNNKYFGFSGSFAISAAYSTGSVRMLIDSYSITRIA